MKLILRKIIPLSRSDHWKFMEVQNMETYKNDYKKEEDFMMWELHEIRHKIYTEYKDKYDEINKMGEKIYNDLSSKIDVENSD